MKRASVKYGDILTSPNTWIGVPEREQRNGRQKIKYLKKSIFKIGKNCKSIDGRFNYLQAPKKMKKITVRSTLPNCSKPIWKREF